MNQGFLESTHPSVGLGSDGMIDAPNLIRKKGLSPLMFLIQAQILLLPKRLKGWAL
ncbi:MAG: hypothetical protein OXE77_06850 [Flavobacteriaceae bacterium]|nr:hypothetical protein [Flavobacteriaceae bacterium]MCY4267519.1 hypothetical protein [Flavobacteriaceae bacterium]MCY4299705.1 hypothetical protein [Flavobacteriaceae bacterium]